MSRITLLLAGVVVACSTVTASASPTAYTYDTLGRVSTVTYPNGTVITYSYDPAGNRTAVVTTAP
jgi:YD repeat-containing protein